MCAVSRDLLKEMGPSDGSPNHSILSVDALWYLNETIEYQANMVKRNTITLVKQLTAKATTDGRWGNSAAQGMV
ncbi:hypothetical protein I7I50_11858 [Histoplasma capsulatum G186AR]|uniref:Uncharacterized protein n=1 Tax=Ajellomyces capsulatus TaxID=5037 RepID=A0A8H7YC31_AJECA|nr:hypothetical protein I7I52_10950 [Histoplasma capsulatum]QSS70280.1 hypothetical protein I7I50_11858 [Histoplasma capsulatum G186AR]